MNIEKLFHLYNGLTVISQKELPPRVAFLMQENISEISPKVKSADAVQKGINKKYIDPEKPKSHLIEESIRDGLLASDYNAEMDELLFQEVDVSLQKLSKEKLLDILEKKEIDIAPWVIGAIQHILTE